MRLCCLLRLRISMISTVETLLYTGCIRVYGIVYKLGVWVTRHSAEKHYHSAQGTMEFRNGVY